MIDSNNMFFLVSPTLEFTHNSTIQKYFANVLVFVCSSEGAYECVLLCEKVTASKVCCDRHVCMYELSESVWHGAQEGPEWPLIFNVRIRHVVKQRQERLQPAFTSTASESMSVFTLITIRSKQRLSNQGIYYCVAIYARLCDLQTQIHESLCMCEVEDFRLQKWSSLYVPCVISS